MPTIEALTMRVEPVAPDAPASHIQDRFTKEPDTSVIAVVDDGRPLGLIERGAFYKAMATQPDAAATSAARLMDSDPTILEPGLDIDAFCQAVIHGGPRALAKGFLITRQGRYLGVGCAASMLQAMWRARIERAEWADAQAAALTEAEKQARSAAEAKSRFVALMSQELRTPMNGVLAVADMLSREKLNEGAARHVTTIVESSQALLQTLEDAVDLARAESGELELHVGPTALQALMDQIQTEWAPRAAENRVSLMVGYEGDTELVADLDGARVKQVFDNLIGNALSFARDGVVEARLNAVAGPQGVKLEARVRDDGPGLDPARVGTLFDGPDGTRGEAGLGLSICQQLIQQMGGRIAVQNNAGPGATFAFALTAPLSAVETQADSNVETLDDLDLQATPHVLIVDDNATNRIVAQALCEMFGCSSELAEDGVQAVEAVSARPFDLILMDIKMPRMDGVEATRAIRALEGPASEIPIVALTANADPDDAKGYLAVGMAAVVEKPIKPERLRLAMNTALEQACSAQTEAGPVQAVA